MKTLNPLRRNTAAIKWTFNASRNCEGHGLFQFLSGRPISTSPGRTQLTKLLLVLLVFLRLLRLPSTNSRIFLLTFIPLLHKIFTMYYALKQPK